MRKIFIALAAIASLGLAAAPLATSAEAAVVKKKVIIKSGHHDHGRHRGWHHGKGHTKKVVIIKRGGHRHHRH